MVFTGDLYVERDSWLHRADPRVKLALVALGIAATLMFRNLFVLLAALALGHLLILTSSVPRDRLMWVWKRMLPLNVLIPLLIFLLQPEGEVFLRVAFMRFTITALVRGIAAVLRLDAIAFLVFAWIFTTNQTQIVRGFVKLGLPFNAGLVLALGLRYIPLFYGLFRTISEAQEARGLDLKRGSLFRRLRNYIPILVAMVISALRSAENLSRALEARALGLEGVKRTYLHDIVFRPADTLFLLAILTTFAVASALRFGLGVGVDVLQLWP
jgi:energy-coupling factor transport system permease protein